MNNAISYVRISTEDQSTYSLDYQQAAIRKYCTENKLNLIALFEDNGQSSYTFDRPDWKALETFIRKNKNVQYLIIYDHDRFSRNLAEALMKIKELQTKFDIKVLATTDRLDLDLTDPSTYIMRAFRYMMAESELMRIRERTKAGMMHAALSGYHANKAPFGYLNSRTEDGKPMLIEDKEKAFFVREAFRMRLEGYSPEKIRHALKPHGFKMTGNGAVQQLLANPVYAGYVKVPAYKNKPAHLVKGKHKPLIKENDYWTVQGKTKGIATQDKDEVPLRGVLTCWCGKHVTAGNSKGRSKYYWYYLCTEHRVNMSAVKLHDQLNQILTKISMNEEEVNWFRERFVKEIGQMMQGRADELGTAKADLDQVKKKIAATEERYLSNQNISVETFNKIMAELKTRKAAIEKQIAVQSASTGHYMKMLDVLLPKLLDLKQAYEQMKTPLKHKFIRLFFGENLNWVNGSYRTAYLHPFIADKELILKENGLLFKEQPVKKIGDISESAGKQRFVEPITALYQIFVA